MSLSRDNLCDWEKSEFAWLYWLGDCQDSDTKTSCNEELQGWETIEPRMATMPPEWDPGSDGGLGVGGKRIQGLTSSSEWSERVWLSTCGGDRRRFSRDDHIVMKCKETLAEEVKDMGVIRHGLETLESTGQGFGRCEFQKWDNGRTNSFSLFIPSPMSSSNGIMSLLFPFKFMAPFSVLWLHICIYA